MRVRAGIIDDIYGADFVSGSTDGNVQDQNGHGTFVTGVVGAVGNNKVGVTGVNQVCGPALRSYHLDVCQRRSALYVCACLRTSALHAS